jgi:hypothetical protein
MKLIYTGPDGVDFQVDGVDYHAEHGEPTHLTDDADKTPVEFTAEQVARFAGRPDFADGAGKAIASVDSVPDGTAAEVVAWAGSDPIKAAAALAKEQERPNPRKTVTDPLTQLVPNQEG